MSGKTAKPAKEQGNELEKRLGHVFARPEVLQLALTHSSLAFEKAASDPATADNEQMEFLGDAVLGMLVADVLFRRFPSSGEGDLTRMRAMLVSRKHMGQVADRIGLGEHLLLGRGEERSGGRKKPVLLANAMEAVLAAVYLDGGIERARTLVEREIVDPRMEELTQAAAQQANFGGAVGDYKSALQELLQSSKVPMQARYVVAGESGPDHSKHFRIELHIKREGEEVLLATGEGATKKQAQQGAAEQAYRALHKQIQAAT